VRQLTVDHLSSLLTVHEPPCISLYQPTHRHHPDNQQDPIRYRNVMSQMETALREKYPARDVQALLEKFQALSSDNDFWNHRTDGLAILSSPERFEIFEVQRPVRELLVVADSFHVKPLIRILQSADRFHILCLNRHEANLYEGNRDALDPVELTGMPATITEALGDELTEPHQTVASYGMGTGKGGKEMHHGHGAKKDEVDVDVDRFFRVIDRAILEHHSRPSRLPVMLAALPGYHTPFRAVSHNPFLMADGLQVNPQALSLDELRTRAWQAVEPLYLARLAELVESYEVARSRKLGSEDLAEVAEAAMAGRVGTLLVEADREIAGGIDLATGETALGDPSDMSTEDLLDDLAEAVLRMKGKVVVVPAERMPTTTGVAATYRF
jgi:Bacterial archaeo-eukaryotic release factor family 3